MSRVLYKQRTRSMKLTNNAKVLLDKRYFQPNETWPKLSKRVAQAIANAEKTDALKKKWAIQFISIIESGEFIPATPFLMNAGISDHFFSCYVLPVGDSLEEIYNAIANAARIFQMAGGVGYDFSELRPKGCRTTKNPKGVSSGPISFMKVFDASCNEITQGGARKGAQMGTLSISHPDIEEFIEAKQDLTQLTQFNVSCTITDGFMDAVKNDEEFQLKFPSHAEMDRTVKAKDLWKKIIYCAWRTGEPGVIFIDEVNRKDTMGGITATNPCAEQPLPPYGCCDLGSIDLAKMVTRKGEFDQERYEEVVAIATRFLDNAIDVNNYTLPEIKERQTGERRIGLGIMGFADALIELQIPYDSDDARHWAENIAKTLEEVTRTTSEALAEEKGAFPLQAVSKLADNKPIRNCMLTTIAPTGSISIVAGCSSGIEPIYALVFVRKHDLAGHEELVEVNNAFQQVAIERDFYSEELMKKISANSGSCQGVKEVPEDVQKVFKVSADLFPADHVNMLATWQKHIQSGVSKTINLAESATEEDVEKAYWQAYESKCKGITVFRDKCRGGVQVLNAGISDVTMEERPEIVSGATMRVLTALGKMYITVNKMQNGAEKPFEVFIELSKGGNNAAADAEAIARLVSLALRSKVNVREIVEQLKGIGAGEVAFNKGRVVSSIPDAVSYVLERMCLNGEEAVEHPDTTEKSKYFPSGTQVETCVDCG